MIRIVVAADNPTRSRFRSLSARRPGMRIVGEARDGIETLRLIQEHRPDVLLIDIALPERNGFEVTARVKAEVPDVHVVIYSTHRSEDHLLRGLKAGAEGFVVRRTSASEFRNAILAAARGESYVCSLAAPLLADYVRRTLREPEPLPHLTPRQREVLQLIAEGKKTREIGQILGISTKTVETHRTRLMDELDLHDVAALVRYAIRSGVIAPDK